MSDLKYTGISIYFMIILIAALHLMLFTLCEVAEAIPVFPGAEGFGTTTVAGSGRHLSPPSTTVYKVTNLSNSGPGSLREAMEASGPRVVTFEVSGTITLTSPIALISANQSYLTVAGQTAPSPGITLKHYGLSIQGNAHDVLIQHLRIRIGKGNGNDGISIAARNSEVYNIVIDHCSITWANDGALDVFENTGGNIHDVTIRQCIIAETLSPHALASVCRSVAGGDGIKNISYIGNLYAHHESRHPNIGGGTEAILVNNVSYNSIYYHIVIKDPEDNGPHKISAIGNVTLKGPSTVNSDQTVRIMSNTDPTSQVYVNDNICPNPDYHVNWECVRDDPTNLINDIKVDTPPVTLTPLTVKPAAENVARDWVLDYAGPRPGNRDAVDKRIISDVRNGTGTIIDSEDDVGGWPELSENTRSLTLPNNPNDDDDGDGYTNLEEWLHEFAAQIEGFTPRLPPEAPTGLTVEPLI